MKSRNDPRPSTGVLVVRIHRERSSEGGAVVERLELSKSGRYLLRAGVDVLPPTSDSSPTGVHGGWVRRFLPKVNEAA